MAETLLTELAPVQWSTGATEPRQDGRERGRDQKRPSRHTQERKAQAHVEQADQPAKASAPMTHLATPHKVDSFA